MNKNLIRLFLFSLFVFTLVLPQDVFSQSKVDELKNQIKDKNDQIREIEREIAEYEKQLLEIGAEKDTLKNAIRTLDLSRQKIAADIRATEQKIANANLSINRLNLDINDIERRINQNNEAIALAIRRMNERDSVTIIENVLSHQTLSEFWNDVDNLEQVQLGLQGDLETLRENKENLSLSKKELEAKKRDLSIYGTDLSAQKNILDTNKQQKNTLLKATENEESQYQALLNEKIALKEAFEKELFEIESALQFEIDPNKLPSVGSGVLAWPLDSIYVTQYFGNTPFASQNPQVYNGKGHNGVDFRAPVGTRVKSALSGTVVGIGNTDQYKGCYSYGKWVLIKHNNGLSTLYAHLSEFAVNTGQSVSTGDIIGYSGNTGFSTGPHLHFTVYASEGVQIQQFTRSVNCKNATIPIADLKAYLNPLSYL